MTMFSFQNCSKQSAIKLSDQASKSPTPVPLPGEVGPPFVDPNPQIQNKSSENFDVAAPSSVVIDQGQPLPDIYLELVKTGSGDSKLILDESNFNEKDSELGGIFDRRTEVLQKQKKGLRLKNINTNTPGSFGVGLIFKVIDSSGKTINIFNKFISITVRSKMTAGSGTGVFIDYSESARCGILNGSQSVTGFTNLESQENNLHQLCGIDKNNNALLESGSVDWTTRNGSQMPPVNSVTTSKPSGVYQNLFSEAFTGSNNAPTVVQWKCKGKDKDGLADAKQVITCRARTAIVSVATTTTTQPAVVVATTTTTQPSVVVATPSPEPVCGTSSITAKLTARAKFFDTNILLQGSDSMFALPGPGFTAKYTLQFFKSNGSLMTLAELSNCLFSNYDTGFSYYRFSVDRDYNIRFDNGGVSPSHGSVYASTSGGNALEYTGNSWGTEKISIQTKLGIIEATSNPMHSIRECNVSPTYMRVSSSGELTGTVTQPSSSFSGIQRDRDIVVVYHCGAQKYNFASPIVNYTAPNIERVQHQLNCPFQIGSSTTKDYYVRFMYFNSVGDPQCISSEFSYTSN